MKSADRPKSYRIFRWLDGSVECAAVPAGATPYAIRRVAVHSPSGYEVGYGGSGPADLALSILADWFGDSQGACSSGDCAASFYHQEFKRHFVAGLQLGPGDSVTISGRAIAEWLAARRPQPTLPFPAPPPAPVAHNDMG